MYCIWFYKGGWGDSSVKTFTFSVSLDTDTAIAQSKHYYLTTLLCTTVSHDASFSYTTLIIHDRRG